MHKCFFVFISVYLKAFLIDLSDVLKECDELVRQKPFHLNKKLKLKLRDVIIYHLSILEFVFKYDSIQLCALLSFSLFQINENSDWSDEWHNVRGISVHCMHNCDMYVYTRRGNFIEKLFSSENPKSTTSVLIFQDFSIFDSDTLMALNGIIYFLIFMFLFCYFADEVAMNCENISLAAYNLQWYKDYPLPIQKYLILIMVRAQHPSQFHGLNMFKVSLDFFTNVIKLTIRCIFVLENKYYCFADDENHGFVFLDVQKFTTIVKHS